MCETGQTGKRVLLQTLVGVNSVRCLQRSGYAWLGCLLRLCESLNPCIVVGKDIRRQPRHQGVGILASLCLLPTQALQAQSRIEVQEWGHLATCSWVGLPYRARLLNFQLPWGFGRTQSQIVALLHLSSLSAASSIRPLPYLCWIGNMAEHSIINPDFSFLCFFF